MEETKQLFSDFEHFLQETIKQNWKIEDEIDFIQALCTNSKAITQKTIHLSQVSNNLLLENNDAFSKERLELMLTNYAWLPQMKSYLLLWRDTIFQVKKAIVLRWDNVLTIEEFNVFKQQAYQVIEEATLHLVNFIDKQVAFISESRRNSIKAQITEWGLQNNPMKVYESQIKRIEEQCQKLMEDFKTLEINQQGFKNIYQLINNNIERYQMIVQKREGSATETIDFITSNILTKKGKIATHIRHLENNIEYNNNQEAFSTEFEKALLNITGRANISISTNDGFLQTKEISFQRKVKQWTEAEILPLMYEVWEIMEFITDNLKMAMMNIQNRASIIAQEQQTELSQKSIQDVSSPLSIFLKRTDKWREELEPLLNLIKERLEDNFKLSIIYHTKNDFLPIPLQSTLNSYWFADSKYYQELNKYYKIVAQRVQQFISSVEQETTLSSSEKIVRYVQTKKTSNENYHYSSIFLTKGYIGEAFWIERKLEMQHIKGLIDQWRLGFRGSLLLHGQRFSGKTLFGEMVANRYFSNNLIRLSPNSIIHFNGRKLQTTYDLETALEFIKKYNTNLQPLVWIDDLELWASTDCLITENIRTLKKYIDNNSHNIFFMVSMSNWTKEHFNKIHEIEKVFQADFNLDRMNVEETQRAILIRHGATHRTLVDENRIEVSQNQLRKMTQRVAKSVNGNIGEALNLWANSIKQIEEDNVKFDFHQNYPIPDFINPDIGIVLSSIMMEKRTSEYRLSKLFGQRFQEKYRNIIQRLISVGLLVRHLDGNLEVNEVVVNEVGRLLEREKYLKFSD